MSRCELKEHDLQPDNSAIDLNAKFTEDYHLDHATELSEALLSMKDEEKRRAEMENDAFLKASMFHEEIFFRRSERYKKIVSEVTSVLDGSGVYIELPDNVNLKNVEHPFDYLISKCLRFDHDSKVAICQTVSDGIFDTLGIKEDKRPALTLMAVYNGRSSKYGRSTRVNDDRATLGTFVRPKWAIPLEDTQAEKNGSIEIILPNFPDGPDIRDILSAVEHECFHAYQYNHAKGNTPIETVRDRVMRAAYSYGEEQYINGKNDYEGYWTQGYESSARRFASLLEPATDIIITDAIKRAMKGSVDE